MTALGDGDRPVVTGMQHPASRLRQLLLSLGFGAGSFGANVAIFPVTSLLLYFLTETVGLSIALATIVISVPKVWDILVDPAIGAFADRYARKRGNRSAVFSIVAVALPVAASAVFLLPPLSPMVFAILGVLILIVNSTVYTVFLVSHVATADDIGVSGAAPRNAMLAVRIIGQAGGALLAGAAAPFLISLGADRFAGYHLMAGCLAIVSFAGIALCAFAVRGTPCQGAEAASGRANTMRSALRDAAARPAALGLIASNFGVMIAASYLDNVLPYVNKYVLRESDLALSPMFTAQLIAMLVGASCGPWFAARIGNRRALRFATLWLIASAMLFYPASHSVPTLVVALALWGMGMGSYTVLLQSSLLDAAKGADATPGLVGLLLGLLFSTGKIGDTLGGVITGVTLTASGGGPAMAAHDSATGMLRAGFGLVPALIVATGLGFLIYLGNRAHATPS